MERLSDLDTRRLLRLAGALVLVVGCTKDTAPAPSTLIDGSSVRPSPIAFEGVGSPRVMTRVRVVPAGSQDGRALRASCASHAAPNGPVVERIGVSGGSVTFFDPGQRGVHACDATDLRHWRARSWCAHAFGRVAGLRLRDPRLTITCRDADGSPIGFAWVQPSDAAAYVVARQPGYAEVYAASGITPVRVKTTDVDLSSSHATFAISEHARDGARLRSYDLEAQVTG